VRSVSYGKVGILTSCKTEIFEQIVPKFVKVDYVDERNACLRVGKNPFTGAFW